MPVVFPLSSAGRNCLSDAWVYGDGMDDCKDWQGIGLCYVLNANEMRF